MGIDNFAEVRAKLMKIMQRCDKRNDAIRSYNNDATCIIVHSKLRSFSESQGEVWGVKWADTGGETRYKCELSALKGYRYNYGQNQDVT
jgi:hypothetical protein